MKRTHCIAIAALALGVLAAVPSAKRKRKKKVSYAITELPALSDHYSYAFHINNIGEVVGSSYEADGIGHACLWKRINGQWVINDLRPLLPNHQSTALGINNWGQIVGYSAYTSTSGTFTKEAFFCDNETSVTSLQLEGLDSATANDINNLGQVVGYSRPMGATTSEAYLWEYSVESNEWVGTILGSFPNCYFSSANEINDVGQVVGNSRSDSSSTDRAGLWENVGGGWTFTNLNDVGGPAPQSSGSDINDLGQIVGRKYTDGTNYYAVLWERIDSQWTARDLSVVKPSGFTSTYAAAINNSGQVVGGGGESSPFLYQDGVMYDLNNFLPAGSVWTLWSPSDINDAGQIVGTGRNSAGIKRAFLMDTQQVAYSYTSTGGAVSIKDNSAASKAMTLTDNVTITDLNVKVTLYHTRYADLKFELIGPDNVTPRTLCAAGAVTGSGTKTLVFDDEGAVGTIQPVYKLSNYDGTSTAGKWTLKITDTVKNYKTGSFTSFTLDVVPL